jgi:hypothetical protein
MSLEGVAIAHSPNNLCHQLRREHISHSRGLLLEPVERTYLVALPRPGQYPQAPATPATNSVFQAAAYPQCGQ